MAEIIEIIKQITTIILTPLLVFLITKRLDSKIDKRFESIEQDVKKIKHELDVDKDVASFIHNVLQFYNYYYELYKDRPEIKIVGAICDTILNNLIFLLDFETQKDNLDDIKVILKKNIHQFFLLECNIKNEIKNELKIYFNFYYSKIIDIVLDVYNKKQPRIVRETNELIKAIFLTFFKEEKNEDKNVV